jgi:hypothetical protein
VSSVSIDNTGGDGTTQTVILPAVYALTTTGEITFSSLNGGSIGAAGSLTTTDNQNLVFLGQCFLAEGRMREWPASLFDGWHPSLTFPLLFLFFCSPDVGVAAKTFTVQVIAEDEINMKTYTIKVYVASSTITSVTRGKKRHMGARKGRRVGAARGDVGAAQSGGWMSAHTALEYLSSLIVTSSWTGTVTSVGGSASAPSIMASDNAGATSKTFQLPSAWAGRTNGVLTFSDLGSTKMTTGGEIKTNPYFPVTFACQWLAQECWIA